jgi:hypothetical protein
MEKKKNARSLQNQCFDFLARYVFEEEDVHLHRLLSYFASRIPRRFVEEIRCFSSYFFCVLEKDNYGDEYYERRGWHLIPKNNEPSARRKMLCSYTTTEPCDHSEPIYDCIRYRYVCLYAGRRIIYRSTRVRKTRVRVYAYNRLHAD